MHQNRVCLQRDMWEGCAEEHRGVFGFSLPDLKERYLISAKACRYIRSLPLGEGSEGCCELAGI